MLGEVKGGEKRPLYSTQRKKKKGRKKRGGFFPRAPRSTKKIPRKGKKKREMQPSVAQELFLGKWKRKEKKTFDADSLRIVWPRKGGPVRS